MMFYETFLEAMESFLQSTHLSRYAELLSGFHIVVLLRPEDYDQLREEAYTLGFDTLNWKPMTAFSFPVILSTHKVWIRGEHRRLYPGEVAVVFSAFLPAVAKEDYYETYHS